MYRQFAAHARGARKFAVQLVWGWATREWPVAYAVGDRDEADLRVTVEEARRFGLPVAVHAHGFNSIADATAAGVSTIEHCSWMSDLGSSDFREGVADHMASARIVACSASSGNARALTGRVAPEPLDELF